MQTIKMTLDPKSIASAIKQLDKYQLMVERKLKTVCERLATMGATNASLLFSRTAYTGDADYEVSVEERGDKQYAIVASGNTVLILEFGAGIRYGSGHPQAQQFGYGPGTYPNQKHAMDPKGWWTPAGEHTYGNAPSMAMYNTAKDLEKEVERVVQEVFAT